MRAGMYVIAQWWHEHHRQVIGVGVVAWVVFITLVYQRINARQSDSATSPQGTVARILPVGGLPVT
jgi:hypothetical protein